MAAPVLLSPSTRLFGWEIDGREPDPYNVIEQFRTGRFPTPYLQPATDLVGRALALVVGPVAALNALVLFTFPLSAAAAYALARRVGASHIGSTVTGLAYAFSPFHVAHAAIHPHIAQTQWFPLYLLTLWLCAEDARPARLALLAAAAALTVLSNFYAGLMLVVLTPLILAGLWFAVAPERSRRREVLRTAAVLSVGAVIGIGLLLLETRGAITHPSQFAFTKRELFLYSAKWWSYLVPAMGHAVLGEPARRFWMQHGPPARFVEQQVFLGWSLLLLAAAALVARRTRAVLFFAGLAACALVCSLSPARQIGPFLFVRPSALIYEWAPMFRCYARFGMIVQLAVAVLAGLGVTALLQTASRTRRLAVAVVLGALVVEYAPVPWLWRDVLPTQGHRFLAEQTGPIHVLDCVPFSPADVNLASLLGHPVSFLPQAADCDPALGLALSRWGATHLVVRRASPQSTAFGDQAVPPAGLVWVRAFDDSFVFAAAPPARTDAP